MRKIIAGTVAVIALGAAIPLAALAGSDWHGKDDGHRHGDHAMIGHHGEMRDHHGERGDRRGGMHGMHGGGVRAQIRMQEFLATYDADDDGRVTQEEVDRWRADRLASFDADGNGQLSLAEYEQLWLDAMRERMVDQFQSHDDDGDGQVTVEEFGERTGHMVMMRDRNEDGVISMDDLRRGRGHGPRGDRPMPSSEAGTQQDEQAAPGTPPMLPDTTTEQQ